MLNDRHFDVRKMGWDGELPSDAKMLQTFYAKIYFCALPPSKLNINCADMKRTRENEKQIIIQMHFNDERLIWRT